MINFGNRIMFSCIEIFNAAVSLIESSLIKSFLVLLLSLFLIGCNNSNKSKKVNPLLFNLLTNTTKSNRFPLNPNENPSVYFSTMTALQMEIIYESSADPYAGEFQSKKNPITYPVWSVTKNNLASLFKTRNQVMNLSIPMTVSEMRTISDSGKSLWSLQDVYDRASSYRVLSSTSTTGSFLVLYVNGYLEDDGRPGKPNKNVMGINLNGTSIIAIFKPVIKDQNKGNLDKTAILEQATIVHEMGHALGLVNMGVHTDDLANGRGQGNHCSNQFCVMFRINNGIGHENIPDRNDDENKTLIFESECLNDIKNFKP